MNGKKKKDKSFFIEIMDKNTKHDTYNLYTTNYNGYSPSYSTLPYSLQYNTSNIQINISTSNKIIVGIYARVSTKDKDQNPENQLIKLRDYANKNNWSYIEYIDYASGYNNARESYQKMINNIDNLNGILSVRLDRLGRSVRDILNLITLIKEKKKFLIITDQNISIGFDKDNAINDFLITILSAVAELERSLISERVRDGIYRAKKQGKKIGRPQITEKKDVDFEKIKKYREMGYSYRKIAKLVNIKTSTLFNLLKKKK